MSTRKRGAQNFVEAVPSDSLLHAFRLAPGSFRLLKVRFDSNKQSSWLGISSILTLYNSLSCRMIRLIFGPLGVLIDTNRPAKYGSGQYKKHVQFGPTNFSYINRFTSIAVQSWWGIASTLTLNDSFICRLIKLILGLFGVFIHTYKSVKYSSGQVINTCNMGRQTFNK